MLVQLCGNLFQTVKNALAKDDKPYNCTICGKSFSWADALGTHIRRQDTRTASPTIALSVERASAGQTAS